MKGVVYLHIAPLSGTNVKKFEDTMIMWTDIVRKHFRKSVKVFDKNRLLVGEAVKVDDSRNVYQVKLPRITVEYIHIVGNMCIFSKVILTEGGTEEILYEIPDRWDGVSLWYSY